MEAGMILKWFKSFNNDFFKKIAFFRKNRVKICSTQENSHQIIVNTKTTVISQGNEWHLDPLR